MKKVVFSIVLMSFFYQMNGQNAIKYLELKESFSPDQIVYLFGDNVKLREKPTTEGAVIEKLKITSEVKIIKKTGETYLYNGIEWYWYQVRYKNKTGYIIGGLISLDKKEIDNSSYLISFKKEKDTYKIITRVVNESGNYLENIERFGTESLFSLEVFDRQGIENIKNMAYIDYHAEACGVNGGGYYLFNDGVSFIKAIDLYQVSEAGLFRVSQEVVFPKEKGGIEGKILFKDETVNFIDESSNRTKMVIESCEFIWEGKLLELKNIED